MMITGAVEKEKEGYPHIWGVIQSQHQIHLSLWISLWKERIFSKVIHSQQG